MRIILVRHGESESNTGVHDHTTAGDHKVCLTAAGSKQAFKVGQSLAIELDGALGGSTLVYCSPYLRTRQTLEQMFIGAGDLQSHSPPPRVFEDPRLREIDRGYADPEAQQPLRPIHGYFYYRYAGGESPADCYDRICTFLESMMRQVKRKTPDTVVIVTHGLAIRCFVTRFLHLTVEQFESLDNPDNCDIITIAEKHILHKPEFVSGRWGVSGIRLRKKHA